MKTIKKSVAAILVSMLWISSECQGQVDTALWSNSSRLLEITSSPYYFGDELPGQLRQIAVSINALQMTLGGWNLGLPVPPLSEQYFTLFKDAFNVYQFSAGYSSDSLLDRLDGYCDTWSAFLGAGNKSLEGLTTFLSSQKMKAVRAKDRKQLATINSTLTMINGTKRYAQTMNALLQSGGSLRECLRILVRAAQPLIVYDGGISAIDALLKYRNELPGEISMALGDISSVIHNEKNSFLVNLTNQKTEMINTILNLGSFIYSENERFFFLSSFSKYLGSRNVKYIHDLFAAREVYKSLFTPLLDLDVLASNINPAICSSTADKELNNLIFSSVKSNAELEDYKNCIGFLLLVEAVNCERIASVFLGANRINDFSRFVKESKDIGKACLRTFTYLQRTNYLNVGGSGHSENRFSKN